MFELEEGRKVHFIGVGGIGMSALAEVFMSKKYKVSGSDNSSNANTTRLEKLGMTFYLGHLSENVEGVDLIIYSSAIKENNSELKQARAKNIPLKHRGEMLAMLHNSSFGLAVSGSHGKTTTTSILLSLLSRLGLNPTGVVGGVVKEFGSNALIGEGKYFVAEADESDGSFLHFKPEVAVVTNIDRDHMEHYKTLENIKESFKTFGELVSNEGILIFNADDPNSLEVFSSKPNAISFSISSSSADYQALNITETEGGSVFEIKHLNKIYNVSFPLTGNHNISNALAAVAAAHFVYPNLKDICNKLSNFGGAGRRFDILHDSESLIVVDDYAHHPTEMQVTIDSFKKRYQGRNLVLVFQPHRYTRTKDFWSEFLEVLNCGFNVYISDIYSAGEDEIAGISTINLLKEVSGSHFLKNWSDLKQEFDKSRSAPVAILALGAGSISTEIRNQVNEWTKI